MNQNFKHKTLNTKTLNPKLKTRTRKLLPQLKNSYLCKKYQQWE